MRNIYTDDCSRPCVRFGNIPSPKKKNKKSPVIYACLYYNIRT